VRLVVSVLVGVALGCLMYLVAADFDPIPLAKCPRCAVMTQPWTFAHCVPEAVVGGWICG
jgi:hypothetical protein